MNLLREYLLLLQVVHSGFFINFSSIFCIIESNVILCNYYNLQNFFNALSLLLKETKIVLR